MEILKGATLQEQWEGYRLAVLHPNKATVKEVKTAKRAYFSALSSMIATMRVIAADPPSEEEGAKLLKEWESELASFTAMIQDGVA